MAPILANLRLKKEDIEIELIKKAISISEKAFRRVLKSVKPGKYEFELEAELTHEFLMNRSRGHAFQPIVASGSNACILHYISNNEQIKDGDLILIDFGAEYANYNADITRAIPANGKFSPRQKEVYEAVLDILFFATELLRPGNNLLEVKKEIISFIASVLHKIGLGENFGKDDNEKLVQKYFPHGISHPLGLDVHDVGSRYISFQAGMIFTCEPGIYIEKEAFGIRLENDILITEKGPMNLAAKIPLLAEEIEELMNSA